MYNIPFQDINWKQVSKTIHSGITGSASWQTVLLDGLRIRIVEYSPEYMADHWCQKGHIVYCLEGEVTNENEDGYCLTLTPGVSYIVSDGLSSHRSKTIEGAKLLIIDGDFLKPKA